MLPYLPLFLWRELINALVDATFGEINSFLNKIWWIAALYCGTMLVQRLLDTVSDYLSFKYNDAIDYYLDNVMIDKVSSVDLAFFDSSDLNDKLNNSWSLIYSTKNMVTYEFYADYILCGIGGNRLHEQLFHKVCFTLSNIVEWGGESIYAISEEYELFSKKEDINKSIFKGSDYSINYSVHGSLLPVVEYELLKEHIDLEQHGIIELDFNNEVPFYRFCEIFDRLKRLIEISVLRKINVEKVTAYSSEYVYSLKDTTIEQPIDIYGKDIKEAVKDSSNSFHWKWISLSELVNNNSFENYFGKHEKLAPIL